MSSAMVDCVSVGVRQVTQISVDMHGVHQSLVCASGLGVGYRPANIANTDIRWESQEQWNVGLDLGLLNDRVNLTVDWYKKTSNDMLMPLQLRFLYGNSG